MSKRSSRILDRALPLPLILAIFTCTFFVYRDLGLRMLFGYAALGAVLGLTLVQRCRGPLECSMVPRLALALGAVILLHYALPGARHDEDTFAYMVGMVICLGYVVLDRSEARSLRAAARVLYGSAMAMAAFVLVFSAFPQAYRNLAYPLLSDVAKITYDFFAPLGYGVSLGGYSYTDYVLFLGLAVCAAALLAPQRCGKRLAAILASMAWLGAAMVVLGRRGELLAALAAGAVLIFLLSSPKNRRRVLLYGGAGGVAAVGLVLLFLPQLGKVPFLSRYVQTVEQILAGVDFTSGRIPLLLSAWEGFCDAPVFGLGWGRYLDLSAKLGICNPDGSLFTDCHNIYLQFLCEMGLVGFVLTVVPVFWLLGRSVRCLLRSHRASDAAMLQLAALSFLIQFFLLFLGLYDPSFQKLVFWCFYALALLFLKGAEGGTR